MNLHKSIFTEGPAAVPTSILVRSCKLDIDATKKVPGEGFKRPWPPLNQDG